VIINDYYRLQSLREEPGMSRPVEDHPQDNGATHELDDSQPSELARAAEDISIDAFALAGRARAIGLMQVSLMLESAALEAACAVATSQQAGEA
jgi:hypothetical protein